MKDWQRVLSALTCLLHGACATYEDSSPVGEATSSASGGSSGGVTGSAGATPAAGAGEETVGGGAGGNSSGGAGSGGDATGSSASGGASGSAGSGSSLAGGGSAGDASGSGGGTGGGASGSGATGPLCSDHPLPAKSTWVASASSYFIGNTKELPALATDGDVTSRWSSGKPPAGDEWFEIDFGTQATLRTITLQLGIWTTDFPTTFNVRVSSRPPDSQAAVRAR
jgi:hypothetical protein